VGGQSVNPLVRADDAELIRRLLEQVDQRGIGGEGTDIEASNIENRGSETRTILGEEVEISILETTIDAEVDGGGGESGTVEDVPVYLYVGTVQHGGGRDRTRRRPPHRRRRLRVAALPLMEQVEH